MSNEEEEKEHLPPFFSSWRQMYLALVVYLVLLIGIFYAFSAWMR
jgi:predicted negative regulator of RcsB-dependent stress response